jgi:glycosyltransferase involved in cell wall biosynthesis
MPYTEFYVAPIKRYDDVFVHYWSIVAKTIVRRVENRLRMLKPELCLSTHVFGGLLGSVLKERNLVRRHIYYDLDNFSTISPFDTGLSTQISHLENKIAQNADVVWSVSRTLGSLRKAAGARKVLIVPNAVDRDLFARAVKLRESRSASSFQKALSIVYAGTIHPNWGVDVLLQAFDVLMKKGYNIKLLLVGPAAPPLLEAIRALQSAWGFDKLQYFGVVPRSKFCEVLSLGEIGVAPYKLDSHAGYGDPLKIKEYVAAGLPVISSPIGEIQHFLQENNVGVTCEPSVNALAEAIITLIERPQLREELTKNALQLKLSSWEENFGVAFKETFEAIESATNIETKKGSPEND